MSNESNPSEPSEPSGRSQRSEPAPARSPGVGVDAARIRGQSTRAPNTPTGPVIFSVAEARTHLATYGEVVSFRVDRRTTGRTWWRATRTGPKRGDCTIQLIGPTDADSTATLADQLRPYVDRSGFETVEAWLAAIRTLHGASPVSSGGHLYYVSAGHPDVQSRLPEVVREEVHDRLKEPFRADRGRGPARNPGRGRGRVGGDGNRP